MPGTSEWEFPFRETRSLQVSLNLRISRCNQSGLWRWSLDSVIHRGEEVKTHEDKNRGGSDAATSQGMPGVTRSWKEQTGSPLKPSERAQLC